MNDTHWMLRALDLAERGRGYVEPNPLVGAVVVRDGKIVGEGCHERFGGPHAEIHALRTAGETARGATLYVTLEPCCHQGKTPPCTDALIQAGITRVVAAMADPFPQVAGCGAAQLRAAGIAVELGLCEVEARRLNAPYLKLLATGRPYVHIKWAMSFDGKIATATGESKWISNETSRRKAHELRGHMDAIIIGSGTALADNPLLTARPPGPRTACRVVLDSRGRLPLTSQLVKTAREVPTLVVSGLNTRAEPLEGVGCEGLKLATGENGRPTVASLLNEFGRRRWTNVLVEGGAEVLGSFIDAGAGDEVHIFVAPLLIGGTGARSPLGGRGVAHLKEVLRLRNVSAQILDSDLYVHATVTPKSQIDAHPD
jgi:diaminohydroxyphosphoribosylaminopyrimidine deaminase / 5-amino-6-(5-phosphoribosylamino)uracil reductase